MLRDAPSSWIRTTPERTRRSVTSLGRGEFEQAKSEFETSLRLSPSSFSILIYYVGWAQHLQRRTWSPVGRSSDQTEPELPAMGGGFLRYACFAAGRYKDALHVMERQTPDNYTRGAWVQRTASFAMLGRVKEARAMLDETMKRYPNLSIEEIINNPELNDTEREHLIRTMKLAGFPVCSKPEVKPKRRLPECASG